MAKPAIRSLSMIKINMACGQRDFGADWIHIDGGDYAHLDYRSIEELEFDDHSQAYLPHMDKDNGTLISLYVGCVK